MAYSGDDRDLRSDRFEYLDTRDREHDRGAMERLISDRASRFTVLDADRCVREELGNSIFANMCLLGAAWQTGHIPLKLTSIDRAIDEDGFKTEENRRAFELGRQRVMDAQVPAFAEPANSDLSVHALIMRYADELTAYQDAKYAEEYRSALMSFHTSQLNRDDSLTRLAAENLFKLMAYKDEYEVARLYTSETYKQSLAAEFEGPFKVGLHMAPPLFAPKNSDGSLRKIKLPSFVFHLMPLLAAGKRLRGTWADPFGRTQERKMERALRDQYIEQLADLTRNVDVWDHGSVARLLAAPRLIKGYGHIKEKSVADYKVEVREVRDILTASTGSRSRIRLIETT